MAEAYSHDFGLGRTQWKGSATGVPGCRPERSSDRPRNRHPDPITIHRPHGSRPTDARPARPQPGSSGPPMAARSSRRFGGRGHRADGRHAGPGAQLALRRTLGPAGRVCARGALRVDHGPAGGAHRPDAGDHPPGQRGRRPRTTAAGAAGAGPCPESQLRKATARSGPLRGGRRRTAGRHPGRQHAGTARGPTAGAVARSRCRCPRQCRAQPGPTGSSSTERCVGFQGQDGLRHGRGLVGAQPGRRAIA